TSSASAGIQTPMSLPATNTTTVVWFKNTATNTNNGGLFSLEAAQIDHEIYLSAGHVCSNVYNGGLETICSTGNAADGQWHQAVQVLGNGRQALYVDGVLAATGNQPTSTNTSTGYLWLGCSSDAPIKYLTGSIDQVMILGQALSDAQV